MLICQKTSEVNEIQKESKKFKLHTITKVESYGSKDEVHECLEERKGQRLERSRSKSLLARVFVKSQTPADLQEFQLGISISFEEGKRLLFFV